MDKTPTNTEKKFICTPVSITSVRMGVAVLPLAASESIQKATARDEMIAMTTSSKEQVYYDRKLIVTNAGKSYSGIIQVKPTLTDREKR
jgi:hypothetical protein